MMDQAVAVFEETLTSLFQPDTLIPDQYFETFRGKRSEPEKKLMLAVLEDAVQCFQDNIFASNGRKKKLFEEAEEWILEKGSTWIFSFENVCEVLELNPEYVREGLLRWQERKSSKHRNAKAA
jgi:hypothetical protein